MTKDKLIEATIILAQKYNDLIREKELRFTPFNLTFLGFELNQKTKTQVVRENKKVLDMYNYLKNISS